MKTELKVYIALIITTLSWGLSYIATKIVLQVFSVYSLVFSRFLIASIIFLVLLFIKKFPRFSGLDHLKVIITSFFFPFLYFFLETTALKYTTASEASLIAAIIPIIVLILSAIFLKEKITLVGISGTLLTFIGIALLLFGNIEHKVELKGNFLGNLLMFGAVLSAVFYMVLTRDLGKKYSSFEITSTQIIYGTLFFITLCLFNHKEIHFTNLTLASVCALFFLAIFSTVFGFFCNNYALTKISAAKASVFINGVPVVTAVSASLILHESLSVLQMIGGIIVVGGVAITNLYGENKDIDSNLSVKN